MTIYRARVFDTPGELTDGLRITTGLVVSDRLLRDDLLVTPEQALRRGQHLAATWHGTGRLRYAITPRFSLSVTSEMLDSCAELLSDASAAPPGSLWFTSHVNEDPHEIAEIARLFPEAESYVGTYSQHGLLTPQSVLAHNVHPLPGELAMLAEASAAVSHCASSNFALGSGLFPLREHMAAGVTVALASDVGAKCTDSGGNCCQDRSLNAV